MATKSNTIKKTAMIEALIQSLGVVTDACKKVGIARKTHYEWYNEDSEYHKSVDDISEIALDYVESALHGRITKGDTTAIIFYLKTRGKKRGYIEGFDITSGGNPIIPVIKFTNGDNG